jgi:hypothetical protein
MLYLPSLCIYQQEHRKEPARETGEPRASRPWKTSEESFKEIATKAVLNPEDRTLTESTSSEKINV